MCYRAGCVRGEAGDAPSLDEPLECVRRCFDEAFVRNMDARYGAQDRLLRRLRRGAGPVSVGAGEVVAGDVRAKLGRRGRDPVGRRSGSYGVATRRISTAWLRV
jgi:hypothetical protein